ncbi:MAG: hypothetical protein AB1405_17240, partial [Bdellovibrionota bacterium]
TKGPFPGPFSFEAGSDFIHFQGPFLRAAFPHSKWFYHTLVADLARPCSDSGQIKKADFVKHK